MARRDGASSAVRRPADGFGAATVLLLPPDKPGFDFSADIAHAVSRSGIFARRRGTVSRGRSLKSRTA